MQALFVLAFAIGLGELARGWTRREGAAPRPLRALPLAVLAIGSVYAYSFPGLLWLAGARRASGRRSSSPAPAAQAASPRRGCWPAWRRRRRSSRCGCWRSRIAPELGRIVDFAGFETFDPAGAGPRQPVRPALAARGARDLALRRLPGRARRRRGPGDRLLPRRRAGGLAALAYGLRWWWRRGERALPAALAAAAVLWLYSLLAGTPYQEAKALVLVAPLVAVVSVRALVASELPAIVAIAFLAAAGGSAVLALANGPVGPSGYSPQLPSCAASWRRARSVVEVPDELLDDQHGRDYLPGSCAATGLHRSANRHRGRGSRPGSSAPVTLAIDEDGAVRARRGSSPGRRAGARVPAR